jgi:hypothetical protein
VLLVRVAVGNPRSAVHSVSNPDDIQIEHDLVVQDHRKNPDLNYLVLRFLIRTYERAGMVLRTCETRDATELEQEIHF